MAENLLESYNPLYDVHLRQYFALPHMQKHLRNLGLLESGPHQQNELHAGHVAMMDMMLRNRERVLQQLMDLQRKLDAAEKVELYRRIRSGLTNLDELDRSQHHQHMSRSLSRPARSAAARLGGERRHRRQSLSPEAGELIKRVETDYRSDSAPFKNPKSIYNRLAANVYKYQYLHKLDDRTLHKYMLSLRKQLAKLERFREVSFGPHTMAKHAPLHLQQSWFFRRRSLKSGLAHKPRGGRSQSPGKVTGRGFVDEPPAKMQRRTSASRSRQQQQQRLPPLPKKRSFAASRAAPPSAAARMEKLPPTAVIKPTRKAPPEQRRTAPPQLAKKTVTPVGSRPGSKGSATPVPVQKPTSADGGAASGILPVIGAAAAGAAVIAAVAEKKADEEAEDHRDSMASSPSVSLAASQTTTTDGGQPGADSEWEGEQAKKEADAEVNGGTETRPTPEPFLEEGTRKTEVEMMDLMPGVELEAEAEEGQMTARASDEAEAKEELPAAEEHPEEQEVMNHRVEAEDERMYDSFQRESAPSPEEHPKVEEQQPHPPMDEDVEEHPEEKFEPEQEHEGGEQLPHGVDSESLKSWMKQEEEGALNYFGKPNHEAGEAEDELHPMEEHSEHSSERHEGLGEEEANVNYQNFEAEHTPVEGGQSEEHHQRIEEAETRLSHFEKPNYELNQEGQDQAEPYEHEHPADQEGHDQIGSARSKASIGSEGEGQVQEAEGLSPEESDQIRQSVHPNIEAEVGPLESVRSLASSSVEGREESKGEDQEEVKLHDEEEKHSMMESPKSGADEGLEGEDVAQQLQSPPEIEITPSPDNKEETGERIKRDDEEEEHLIDINGNNTIHHQEQGEAGKEEDEEDEGRHGLEEEHKAENEEEVVHRSYGQPEEVRPMSTEEGEQQHDGFERVKREADEEANGDDECPPEGCPLPTNEQHQFGFVESDEVKPAEEDARRKLSETEELPGVQKDDEEEEEAKLVDFDGGNGNRANAIQGGRDEDEQHPILDHHGEDEDHHEEENHPDHGSVRSGAEDDDHQSIMTDGEQHPHQQVDNVSLKSWVQQEVDGMLNYHGKPQWTPRDEEEGGGGQQQDGQDVPQQRRHSSHHSSARGEADDHPMDADGGIRPATAEIAHQQEPNGDSGMLLQPSIEITPASEYGGSVEGSLASPMTPAKPADVDTHHPVEESEHLVGIEEASEAEPEQHRQLEEAEIPSHDLLEHGHHLTNGGGNGHDVAGRDEHRDEGVHPLPHHPKTLLKRGDHGEEEDEEADERTSLLTGGGGNGHLPPPEADNEGSLSDETEGADEGSSDADGSVIIHSQQQQQQMEAAHHQHHHQQFQTVKLAAEDEGEGDHHP